MFVLLSVIFSIISSEPSETYKPGDRAAILVDLNGDKVGETLIIESEEMDPDVRSIGIFDFNITINDTRGSLLYNSQEIGELGWFSIEKEPFEFEGGTKREIALIRTGCSGTGFRVNAFFIFQPPKTDSIAVIYEGSDGLYDYDTDGIADMLISRYRHDNLGIWGASSPWLARFCAPAKDENWEPVDRTFDVLHNDAGYRTEWIEDVSDTYKTLSATDIKDGVDSEHLKYLKMLQEALQENDTEEARRIYYTSF